jgi:hypothetical protein
MVCIYFSYCVVCVCMVGCVCPPPTVFVCVLCLYCVCCVSHIGVFLCDLLQTPPDPMHTVDLGIWNHLQMCLVHEYETEMRKFGCSQADQDALWQEFSDRLRSMDGDDCMMKVNVYKADCMLRVCKDYHASEAKPSPMNLQAWEQQLLLLVSKPRVHALCTAIVCVVYGTGFVVCMCCVWGWFVVCTHLLICMLCTVCPWLQMKPMMSAVVLVHSVVTTFVSQAFPLAMHGLGDRTFASINGRLDTVLGEKEGRRPVDPTGKIQFVVLHVLLWYHDARRPILSVDEVVSLAERTSNLLNLLNTAFPEKKGMPQHMPVYSMYALCGLCMCVGNIADEGGGWHRGPELLGSCHQIPRPQALDCCFDTVWMVGKQLLPIR